MTVFAVYQHEPAISVLCSPHPEPPSHTPPYPIPLGCPRALAFLPRFMRRTWTGHLFSYGNIHVSMLFSQIIPPLPSLTESKVCSFHLCLLCCLHVGSSVPSFYIPCICFNIQYLSFSF